MRTKTSSYVVSVKLKLPESIKNRLEKSFHIATSAYNEALSFGLRRFRALKQNQMYQELLERRRVDEDRQKKYDQTLFELLKSYDLTEFGLSTHLGRQRKKLGSLYKQLNSGELQVIAGRAYKALEKVLFYRVKPNHLRFRSKYDLNVSYCNRVNTTGTRLIPSDRKGVAYRLYLHKVSTFVDIPVKAFSTYQQMSLSRSEKIKYVQIIRKTIRGKKVYYLQIVCEGTPPAKINRGEGVIGIDPGISTVAYAAPNKVALVDLIPRGIAQKEKFLKVLDRRIERSRRVNNPDCFHADGTIKKSCHFKRMSNRALRLVNRRKKAYRSLSEERKKLQGKLINQLVSNASVIKIEELNVKGLQKRATDLRINPKTNRPFSKKRFGKSVFRAAPGAFRKALKTRATQLGIKIIMVSPRDVKPSQYNHILQTFEKKPLSTRIFDLSSEWTSLQRDLYSAFLIGHIEDGHYQETELEQDFPDFYQHMRDFLQQTPQTSRLAWYFS